MEVRAGCDRRSIRWRVHLLVPGPQLLHAPYISKEKWSVLLGYTPGLYSWVILLGTRARLLDVTGGVLRHLTPESKTCG